MEYQYLSNPCRNFCLLNAIAINDPKDGREKVVLSSFVSGGVGGLVFIDVETGNGEWIDLPGDEGAWALLPIEEDKKLLVGTCGTRGYLHCLDMESRTWAEPLRDENETYIWNLVQGSDGMVYGGTYPGCVLLQYNPKTHVLKNMGKLSKYEGNMYSRAVWQVPGYILINCGIQKLHISIWDIETNSVKAFGKEGAQVKDITSDYICTETDGELDFYDVKTLELLNMELIESKIKKWQEVSNINDKRIPSDKGIGKILKLENNRLFGVRGQEYFILDKKSEVLNLVKIPVSAPATGILTITSDDYGNIWGTSNFGQTIFCYNTENGKYTNTPAVCNNGGEVYGIRCINSKVYMSCYAGGDHVVYDPSMTWDQINNANPKTLCSVYPDLIRPGAKSVIGPDGAFWTGWTAGYGVYGGGISRLDPETNKVTVWKDIIPGQSIRSIASGDKYIYFTTSGWGNGLPEKIEPLFLGVLDTEGNLVWKKEFLKGERLGLIEIVGNFGLVNVDNEIRIFNCYTMEFINSIKMGNSCSCMVKKSSEQAFIFCGKELYLLNAEKGKLEYMLDLPGIVGTAAIDNKDNLYFAQNSSLYMLKNKVE